MLGWAKSTAGSFFWGLEFYIFKTNKYWALYSLLHTDIHHTLAEIRSSDMAEDIRRKSKWQGSICCVTCTWHLHRNGNVHIHILMLNIVYSTWQAYHCTIVQQWRNYSLLPQYKERAFYPLPVQWLEEITGPRWGFLYICIYIYYMDVTYVRSLNKLPCVRSADLTFCHFRLPKPVCYMTAV